MKKPRNSCLLRVCVMISLSMPLLPSIDEDRVAVDARDDAVVLVVLHVADVARFRVEGLHGARTGDAATDLPRADARAAVDQARKKVAKIPHHEGRKPSS